MCREYVRVALLGVFVGCDVQKPVPATARVERARTFHFRPFVKKTWAAAPALSRPRPPSSPRSYRLPTVLKWHVSSGSRLLAPTAEPDLSFDWCLGPTLADRNEPGRSATLEWMFGYLLHSAVGAHLLGVRSPTGELQAAALCWLSKGGEKGPGFKNYVCGGMSYALKNKEVPAYMKNRKLIDKRLTALDKVAKICHAKHARSSLLR